MFYSSKENEDSISTPVMYAHAAYQVSIHPHKDMRSLFFSSSNSSNNLYFIKQNACNHSYIRTILTSNFSDQFHFICSYEVLSYNIPLVFSFRNLEVCMITCLYKPIAYSYKKTHYKLFVK